MITAGDIENNISKSISRTKASIKYTIFISSTYEDLKDERQALVSPLLSKGFIPIGMEQFHAAPASQWDVITSIIDECDYYLLIVGGCYGSIDDETGISYTEKEYKYAKDNNIPIIAFLPRNPGNITKNKMDKEDFGKKQELLARFKNTIENDNNTVGYYEGIEGLKVEVLSSLDNLIFYEPRSGWVRYDSLKTIIQEMIKDYMMNDSVENTDNGKYKIIRTGVTASAGDIIRIPESGIDGRISATNDCLYNIVCDDKNGRPTRYRSFKVYDGYIEIVIAEDVSDIRIGVVSDFI